MWGATFAEVLDEKLDESAPQERRRAVSESLPHIPPHPLLFVARFATVGATAYGPRVRTRGGRPPAARPSKRPQPTINQRAAASATAGHETAGAAAPPPVPPPSPPARILTTRQRDALHGLVQLGATLTEDFSETDLKRAFRMLACAYHPDRHPEAGERDKARLTRLFAELSVQYRELLRACATVR